MLPLLSVAAFIINLPAAEINVKRRGTKKFLPKPG
jgi:hypothetical protein